MDFYDSHSPVAKKKHKCEMCGGDILPGERYSYETGKWDGEFFVRKMHLDCASVLDEYCSEVDSEFDWDSVSDFWRDGHCPECKHYYPECKPEADCTPETCFAYKNGKCTEGETCDRDFDHGCWCSKFEKEGGSE